MFPYNSKQNPMEGSSSNDLGNNNPRGNEVPQSFPRVSPNQAMARQFFDPSDQSIQFPNDQSNRLESSRNFNPGFDAGFTATSPYSAPIQGGYHPGSSRPAFSAPPMQDSMYGSSFAQIPNYRRQESPESTVYVVEFKRNSGDYVIGYRAHIYSALNPGDAVIVACEKGENLGIVTRVLTMTEYLMMKYNTTAINPADINKYFGRIIRVASRNELIALQQKDADEREIVQYCQNLAYSPQYRLNIRIVDAEFQFDRMKLTIYYESHGRVDFRDYVKTLYTTLQVRVWMEKI